MNSISNKSVSNLFSKRLVIIVFALCVFSTKGQVTIFSEGFEHNSLMPSGWTQEYVYDTLNWIFTNGGNSGHPSTAHNGSFNALLYYGGIHRTTRLVTPQLNLSQYNNLQLKFWHAQAVYSGDQDYLRVFYKTSANGTWTLLASYTSSITSWTLQAINLPNPSSTYYIAFEGEARYGFGVVIDDVSITGNVAVGLDIGITGIESPVIFSTGNNTFKINYKNSRSDTIYSANFGYKLDTNANVIDTNRSITDTLFPGGNLKSGLMFVKQHT